jgi:hypothetical protein
MKRVIVNQQVVNTTALCLHNETAGEEYERNSENLLLEHDLLLALSCRAGALRRAEYAPEADLKV